MDFRRVARAAGSVIFYIAVYLVCQLIVSFAVTYSVSFSYVFDYLYSSVDPTGSLDTFSQINFEELLSSTEALVSEFVTENLFSISIVCAIFTLLVYFIIFKIRKKRFAAEVGIGKMSGLNYPIMFVLGISLNFLVVAIISALPIPAHLMEDYADASAPIIENAMTPAAIIFTVIVTPIFEEIVFRGLVYTRIKRCMPMLGAMILSSFFFGVMHGSSIVWVTYASVMGFFMAWAFEKCGSLLASILLHAGFNLVGILTTLLPEDISQNTLLFMFAALAIISVVLIVVVNKNSKTKIEIGMPEWETEKTEND